MKRSLIAIFLLVLCLTTFEIMKSFGVFETRNNGDKDLNIAKWHIYVNDYDLNGNNNTFVVDNVTYTNNAGVSENLFAPGVTGSFLLIIDPKDTQVAFRYDLTIDLSDSGYEQIHIDSIEGVNGTSLTINNDIYSRVVSISDIQNGVKDYIRVTFSWNLDDDYNESDSELGAVSDNTFEIPVNIKFNQYLGE